MFKVQISGRLDGKPRLKRVANRDVCNFTIRCRNEFDKDNLNESAQEVIQNAKENGKFKSMDGELTATLSNNEKYLMIYKDVYTDDTNRPIQERLLTLFKEFEPTGTSSSADNSASSTENSSESQDQENNSTSSATAESAAQ